MGAVSQPACLNSSGTPTTSRNSQCWTHLFASEVAWSPGVLDPVLRGRAGDWAIAGVIMAPADLGWLYHPYDSGTDVLFATELLRDELRDRHREWLSAHPSGC